MYQLGIGVQQDSKKAVEYFKLASLLNDPLSQYNLGVMYRDGGAVAQDETKAVEYFTLSADNGNHLAQNDLGVMYLKGQGVDYNEEQAAKYFMLSSEQGNIAAYLNLGRMFFKGQVKQNGEVTADRFSQAYKNLHIARDNLNSIIDPELANTIKANNPDLEELVAQLENEDLLPKKERLKAQLELGDYYLQNAHLSPVFNVLSMSWFERAAKDGSAEAKFLLAFLYYQQRNYEMGDKLLKESADGGFPISQIQVAIDDWRKTITTDNQINIDAAYSAYYYISLAKYNLEKKQENKGQEVTAFINKNFARENQLSGIPLQDNNVEVKLKDIIEMMENTFKNYNIDLSLVRQRIQLKIAEDADPEELKLPETTQSDEDSKETDYSDFILTD